ncbi:MAG TPA: SDR family NAD(P)-dependent oxidoreductase [Puia sp.]|jgi:short-subunit dehydrogenase|nr:SDR family NAD(P)-dependent oxidoreductase [Puia sp.]
MKSAFLYFASFFIVIFVYAQSEVGAWGAVKSTPLNSPGLVYIDSSLDFANNDTMVYQGDKSRPYALVAGGSKGIGYAISEALAKRGYNLILIARHTDSLNAAKNKLESIYHIHVETLPYDLSLDSSATQIADWCTQRDIPLKMLCNVAGFGGARDYLSLPLDTLRYMINLNIGSAISLTLTLLPLLEKNAPSYILNVGSMAGFAPIPVKNMYSATKSAVVFFSYSLKYQLKEKNISVSVLCPGPVFTKPEIKKDTKEKLGWIGMKMAVSPERVGEIAVRETLNKKLVIVPGTLAKFMAFLIRFLPRRWIVSIYNKAGKK